MTNIKVGRKDKKFIQYYGKKYVENHHKKIQSKLNEDIKSGDFKIGDKVKFKNRNPPYIMVIKRFIEVDYVSLVLPDGDKMFSASCYLSSIEKVK